MFDGILDHFNDFPKTEILFYSPSESYNPMTGEYSESYAYEYGVLCNGFQKSTMKSIFSEKVWDSIDLMFIMDQEYSPSQESIIYHDMQWYKITFPDNIGFDNTVCVIGAQRILEQILTNEDPDTVAVLGDFGGIL